MYFLPFCDDIACHLKLIHCLGKAWYRVCSFLSFCDDIACHLKFIHCLGIAGFRSCGYCLFVMTFHAIKNLFIALVKLGFVFVVFAVLWWKFMTSKAHALGKKNVVFTLCLSQNTNFRVLCHIAGASVSYGHTSSFNLYPQSFSAHSRAFSKAKC